MSEPEEAALAVAENQAAIYPVTLLDRPVGVYTHSDGPMCPPREALQSGLRRDFTCS